MFKFIYCMPFFNLIIIVFALIIIFSIINSYYIKTKFALFCNWFCFLLFLFSIIYKTVFSRTAGNYDVILAPFDFIKQAQLQPEMYRSFFMNASFFVPIGLTMPYILSKKTYKRNVFITIGFAAVLSAVIEFLQYYYHLGRCETDDVIANTLGAAVGALSYCLYMHILKIMKRGV